jgi:hypothetical protein
MATTTARVKGSLKLARKRRVEKRQRPRSTPMALGAVAFPYCPRANIASIDDEAGANADNEN